MIEDSVTQTRTPFCKVKEQVSNDLKSKLEEFRSVSIGLRLLSQKMGISQRTLNRLINKENKANYNTLCKIYRVLLETNNDSVLLELVPENVREEIIKSHPSDIETFENLSLEIDHEISNDRVYGEIYMLAACAPVTKEMIQFRLGTLGIQTIEKMLKQKVLIKSPDNGYILGSNRANMSPRTLQKLGNDLISRYFKPENCDESGKNYIALFAAGLTPEAHNEWLKIDKEAFEKKIEISRRAINIGNKRSVTYIVTDLME